MKQFFTKQLRDFRPITQTSLDKMKVTRLTSIPNPAERSNDNFIPKSCFKRPYEIGDVLLYFMEYKLTEIEGDVSMRVHICSITLGELDELDHLYNFVEYNNSTPVFERKDGFTELNGYKEIK